MDRTVGELSIWCRNQDKLVTEAQSLHNHCNLVSAEWSLSPQKITDMFAGINDLDQLFRKDKMIGG